MRSIRLSVASLFLLALLTLSAIPLAASAAPSVTPLTLSQSGLKVRDDLTSGVTTDWTFSGDAAEEGAPYAYTENSSGLYLGVQSPGSPTWAGFYAVSPNTPVMLFHAVLTLPYSSIPADYFNTGLYVQTSSSFINYVTCYGQASPSGYYWGVLYTSGSATSAQTFTELYTSYGGPMTQDCTIVTNGQNVLRVYLDGKEVYSSNTLNLQMPAPFDAYLEVESSYGGHMLYGKYTDYYATSSDKIEVNAPPGDTVRLVGLDSNATRPINIVSTTAAVGPNGTAIIPVGQYHLPILGTLSVVGPDQQLVATSQITDFWGGDTYQMGSSNSKSPMPNASTTTSLVCSPAQVKVNEYSFCQATVTASSGTISGSVNFSSTGKGEFGKMACFYGGASMVCSATYQPTATGAPIITATFAGASGFSASGGSLELTVTSR